MYVLCNHQLKLVVNENDRIFSTNDILFINNSDGSPFWHDKINYLTSIIYTGNY